MKEAGAAAGGGAAVNVNIDGLGIPQLKLPDLIIVGPQTLDDCEQLMAWSNPMSQPGSSSKTSNPPLLTFSWGSFTVQGASDIKVSMVSVTVTYERFTPQGLPIRATAVLSLKPLSPSTPDQQNPTSGGLPGRSGHLLTSGETLPGVALGTYGAPGRWRILAEANQLDDPLRVRPGAVLYLPNRNELTDGGAA